MNRKLTLPPALEKLIRGYKRLNIPGILYGDILLIIIFSLTSNRFLVTNNLLNILKNCCTLALTATGLTMVILMGKNDISVGSTVSMSAVIVALLVQKGWPTPLVILVPLLVGLAIGLINGVLVAVLKFDYWVVAFSSMSIFAGLALVLTDGKTISWYNKNETAKQLDWIGNHKIGEVYVFVWLTILLVAVMIWVLRHTKFGYDVYSVGGSENVANVSGVKVAKTRIIVYMLAGLFAAIAGVFIGCMTNSGSPSVGVDYSFNAIAVVVFGGTSMSGGKGGIVGTVFGTIMLRILASGLSLMKIPSLGINSIPATWQKAIIGMVIVVMIVVDVISKNRKDIKGLRRVYGHVSES